jgi:hypothetical protein
MKRSADAGRDPAGFAGHPLRGGLATAAAEEAGKSTQAIMRQAERSAETAARCVRSASLFETTRWQGPGCNEPQLSWA